MRLHPCVVVALLCAFSLARVGAAQDAPQVTIERLKPAPFVPHDASASGGSAGVFVGVNEFSDTTLSPLNFAVNDAVEQAYLFVMELKLIPAVHCQLVLGGKPQGDAIERHLRELQAAGAKIVPARNDAIYRAVADAAGKAAGRRDILVVSFSSHGFDERGEAYVMPVNGLARRLAQTAVELRSVEEDMRTSKAGHRLLLVDACQERLSGEKAIQHGEQGKPMPENFAKALERATGQAKLASCSVGELSHEAPGLGESGAGHGVFTFALLEALRGGAAPDAEGLVRLGAVSQYVTRRVAEWVKDNRRQRQSPSYFGPEEARKLPLAAKGSDLIALAAALKRRVDPAAFTPALCDQLIARLQGARFEDAAERELLLEAQRFAADAGYRPLVFAAYVKESLAATRASDARLASKRPPPAIAPFDAAAARRHQQAWAEHLGKGAVITNSIGMKLALIPPGRFTMGGDQPPEDVARIVGGLAKAEHYQDEQPPHLVMISRPFYLGVHEVTQAQYEQVMGVNPSRFARSGVGSERVAGVDTGGFPVESVSWFDAVEFCNKLSQREGLSPCYRLSHITRDGASIKSADVQIAGGSGYRLPTEAQWEYACRAGTATPFHFGAALSGDKANLDGNAPYGTTVKSALVQGTTAVGSYAANALGLFDMHGNVWEWCEDWYDESHYQKSPSSDPEGPSIGSHRVCRGGGWYNDACLARSAYRGRSAPDNRDNGNLGFRVAVAPASR